MNNEFYNQEGYSDPTPYAAMSFERKKPYRPLVYICSPFSSDPEGNTLKARKYSRYAVDKGAIPIAPHLLFPQFMKEETERDLALFMDRVLLGKCKEVWVFGDHISPGMQGEIELATEKNMKVRRFTEDCKEV